MSVTVNGIEYCPTVIIRDGRFGSRRLSCAVVQMSVIPVFKWIEAFEYRGEGELIAYSRQAVLNRIRNEIPAAGSRPVHEALEDVPDGEHQSPLDAAIGSEMLQRYETALDALPERNREAVIARVELGLSYPELADALGKASASNGTGPCREGRGALRISRAP